MEIIIVGGGTAGWLTAVIASARHPNHNITVVESSKIGIIGVGESTTGLFSDIFLNKISNFGCDIQEFIVETGATLKYAIKHRGWTNNINDYYIGPIDGSVTANGAYGVAADVLFAWGLNNLSREDLLTVSFFGYLIDQGQFHLDFESDLDKFNKDLNALPAAAMHIDAHLAGKYFKKIACKRNNINFIDDEVVDVKLTNGFIKSILLKSSNVIGGDLFVDCSGFNKVLMKHLPNKWISCKDNLPLNSALPFQLKYKNGEMPEPYTTAWAQKNGWMWQIPLMDRKGCGYAFCDSFTTADKAQEEIETILGQEIDPQGVIKFDAGRQESAWVKNCVTIGLSSSFFEPLEATSIHCTIVQATNLFVEYVKPTIEDTLNSGSMSIYNKRTRNLYDDIKDFLVLHYMGGRDDSKFWKYIKTGVTQTEYVKELLEMVKSRIPSSRDFPQYYGSAGWPLYSYIMEGINLLDKSKSLTEINFNTQEGNMEKRIRTLYYKLQKEFGELAKHTSTYNEFIEHFRNIRT
jgi:hypothetical protein